MSDPLDGRRPPESSGDTSWERHYYVNGVSRHRHCITCRRSVGGIDDRTVGTVLHEPHHCTWCGRGKSEEARALEELLATKHGADYLAAKLALRDDADVVTS